MSASRLSVDADRGEQLVVIEGLFQEIDGADLHRFDRERNVAVAGDHDHRNIGVEFLDAAQQIDAGDIRHAHVGDDAAGA